MSQVAVAARCKRGGQGGAEARADAQVDAQVRTDDAQGAQVGATRCKTQAEEWRPSLEFSTELQQLFAVLIGLALLLVALSHFAKCQRRRRAAQAAPPSAGSSEDWIYVGRIAHSPDLGPGDLGWYSHDGFAALPRERLNLHVLVAGATGSGKSTTVDRIEMEALKTHRPQLIHFDCKGRRDGAARFMAIACIAFEEHEIRVAPLEPYDGWRGDARAHLNRLLAIQDFSERQPYYTAGTKDLLQELLVDDGRLPRFSSELIERLPRERKGIDPKVAAGTTARYRGFFHSLDGMLDGSWAFEDVEAAYIELPGMARREDATAFGRYLLEDFMHYIAERKDPHRDVLLVLDDFSAISSGQEAVNLVERAREFGVGVVLTTQSYAGLGPGADRIVDACNGALIVHRMSNPEPFTERAGTLWRETTSVTHPTYVPSRLGIWLFNEEVGETRATTRSQEFARIDPNEVRSLPAGDAFVIADGHEQRISVLPVTVFDEIKELPGVGRVSVIDLTRGNLKLRKALNADLHEPVPRRPAADTELDF